MADNYIEKRMAEIAAGKGSSAPASRYPGIDVLFGRVSSNGAALGNGTALSDSRDDFGDKRSALGDSRDDLVAFDPDYKVHPLQIQAVINSVNRLGAVILPGSSPVSTGVGSHDFSLESGFENYPGICISVTADSHEQEAFLAGMLAQSIILKAAEMGLAAVALNTRFVALGRVKQ